MNKLFKTDFKKLDYLNDEPYFHLTNTSTNETDLIYYTDFFNDFKQKEI